MTTARDHPVLLAERDDRAWWSLLSRYHWYVFALASMGWLFDTMDQNLFTISRSVTMSDLLPNLSQADQTRYGTWATSLFIIGWATGGLVFGKIGDKLGRAKTMALTVLLYAVCTGLSGLTRTWGQFAAARLITGLGIGGEFAAGAAFVAEVMPQAARAKALGALQALSGVGNIMAAILFGLITPHLGWRWLYFVGAFPALLAVVVRLTLRESDRWIAARESAGIEVHTRDPNISANGRSASDVINYKRAARVSSENGAAAASRFGRISDLFRIPRWRRNSIAGVLLAVAGVIGLWGVGFYAPELIDSTLPAMSAPAAAEIRHALTVPEGPTRLAILHSLSPAAQKGFTIVMRRSRGPGDTADTSVDTPIAPDREIRIELLLDHRMDPNDITRLKSKGFILQNLGSMVATLGFALVAVRIGRRPTFLIAFLIAWGSVVLTFYTFHDARQIWYLWPILGFGTLAPFGGYVLYFPEIFPTRLRTTGTGLCYNVARYLAATGPLVLGALTRALDGKFEMSGFRAAALLVSFCYLIGIIALIWAPETMGRGLPEDEDLVLAPVV